MSEDVEISGFGLGPDGLPPEKEYAKYVHFWEHRSFQTHEAALIYFRVLEQLIETLRENFDFYYRNILTLEKINELEGQSFKVSARFSIKRKDVA